MTSSPQTYGINPAAARALNFACAAPPAPLRSLALSMVSHQTLLRSPGPLGMFDIDAKCAAKKRQALDELRQIAIIAAGVMLGIVFKNARGELEVR